jgi:hypothetical protein
MSALISKIRSNNEALGTLIVVLAVIVTLFFSFVW